jgi:hypothetical protein
VLGQQIDLPLLRHDYCTLALADDPRILPSLGIQANFVSDRFHRDRELVCDLQSARQHGRGGGLCHNMLGSVVKRGRLILERLLADRW